jgi:hypothetical protein
MTDITIPPEAVEAAARALCIAAGYDPDDMQEGPLLDGSLVYPLWREWEDDATAALRAGLLAWPGMAHDCRTFINVTNSGTETRIILPLTEKPDDKA